MSDAPQAPVPELPDPLAPAEVDLRGYGFMPFYGGHLLGSDFDAKTSDSAWRAAVCLWWSAWNNVPAGSLPDDDTYLAKAAHLGRDVRTWRKLREAALHGFVKCSDGRLYHRFLCPIAIEAYARRKAERDKKRRHRAAMAGPDLLGDGTGTDGGTAPPRERGRGTEQGEGVTTNPPTPQFVFTLPDWVPVEPWNGFVAMRQKIKKPLTERAKKLICDDLQALREKGFDPGKVLEQSEKKNWLGVFEIKDYSGGAKAPAPGYGGLGDGRF